MDPVEEVLLAFCHGQAGNVLESLGGHLSILLQSLVFDVRFVKALVEREKKKIENHLSISNFHVLNNNYLYFLLPLLEHVHQSHDQHSVNLDRQLLD